MNQQPFVSVIICTRNGARHLPDCLEALAGQDYPRDRYEIVVVDDGSTDDTAASAGGYPVRLISHKTNLGTYVSRNTGLLNARGEIIAYTDDDCIPGKDWLKYLVEPYADNNVAAAGGITESFSRGTITEKYMAETGYGNPSPAGFNQSRNILRRFLVYIKDMFSPVAAGNERFMEAAAIYTLNASFRKSVFERIGGWDESLKFGGDTEMSMRIHEKLPEEKIIFTRQAKIIHKHRVSFVKFLKDMLARNGQRIKYYLKYKKIPPVFPFPVLIVLISLALSFYSLTAGFMALLLLPAIFYLWWPVRFAGNPKIYYLLFPYMQFSIEFVSILGMFIGFIKIILKEQKNETEQE